MYQANQQQLPVPYDRWDPGTLNNSLPHGNEIFPPVRQPPNLPRAVMEQIASEFRALAQSRLGKTPLHTFVYNLFSDNHFQNQLYLDWMQRTMDFAEFLIVAQRNQPHVAVGKAVQQIYFGSLAAIVSQFPALSQLLDQAIMGELIGHGRLLDEIFRDVGAFQANGHQPPPAASHYGGGAPVNNGWQQPNQLPPVNMGGYNPRPQIPVHAAMAPSGYVINQTPHAGYGAPNAATITRGGGRYADEPVEPPKALQTFQTGSNTRQHNEMRPSASVDDYRPVVNDTSLPVPTTLDEVVIDPNYYVPRGFEINEKRPYDKIHNPGGVEIRPALTSGWARTRSDIQPYALGYDPGQFVLFHVKWPDGVIQEKIVEWTTDMDYLQHETQKELRSLHLKDGAGAGKVVVNAQKILGMDDELKPVDEVRRTLDHELSTNEELTPVIIEGVFANSSDLENELEARRTVIEELGLAKTTPIVPAHEYHSARAYPLDVSAECQAKLLALKDVVSMKELGSRLEALAMDNILPRRYYRFIDERLTKGLNQVVAENLSMEKLTIESFVGDINDLLNIIAAPKEQKGRGQPEVVAILDKHVKIFMSRWLNFYKCDTEGEESEPEFSLMDEFINLQTGWTIDEIGSINLAKEPVLLSRATHPKLAEVIAELAKRKSASDTLTGRCLRLITADGTYLEIIRGWLVADALLIKKH